MLQALVSALARLGRYDDAIGAWRKQAAAEHDTTVAALLDSARGAQGYWDVRHAEGKRRLLMLEQVQGQRPTSPIWIMRAHFAAGDVDGGFALIDSLARRHSSALYKLPCLFELDEVRGTARYEAAIKQIGVLR